MQKISKSILCFLALSLSPLFAQAPLTLYSPAKHLEVRIQPGPQFNYDVLWNGQPVLKDAQIALRVDGRTLGPNAKILNANTSTVDTVQTPVVAQKRAKIREHYNQLRLECAGGYAVTFRAYDEGIAYRFETTLGKPSVEVQGEDSTFRFAGAYPVYYPNEDGFNSHNERFYLPKKMAEITPKNLASLPAVVDAGSVKVAIAESDIDDYPGLWLVGTSSNALAATFPPYPTDEKLEGDRNFKVVGTASYLAVTKGDRTYPWRLAAFAEKDGDLISNQLPWLLQRPSDYKDTTWIKPGKVAWDWWNANNVYNVPFKSGVNTATYKYFIDFASKYGLEYIVLDEGWYKLGNVLDVVPEINVQELVDYGKKKNVSVILWVVWKTMADQMIPALDQYAKWGVKGIKVDFMQRDDQRLMSFYTTLAREAAKRHMLVDYHGAVRTALMTRTYPNIISTEGVRGLENAKWSADITPEHDVTLPFTRMFLGPMDFTPGAMINAQKKDFRAIFDRPMSQGTRCHQLGMYVVYESPLQMLSDTPTAYYKEPEMMEFLGPVPAVWDETKVLDAKIADYVVVARRHGKDWWIGAMTDWTKRDLTVDLSFLPAGTFKVTAFIDGPNADKVGNDYVKTVSTATAATKLTLKLAPGGGYAARLQQQ